MRRMQGLIAAALVLVAAALVVGACSGGGRGGEEPAAPAEPPPAEASAAGGARADEKAPSGQDLVEATAVEVSAIPSLGQRVIQTASLSLTVRRGLFEESIDRARTIAAGLGGFVTSSSASQGQDGRLVHGTIVLRVPERSYAQAMSQLAKLGKVQAREESGTDVTQQYVDLEARARHLEAVEGQLLGFLGKTETVAEALAVQDRLNQVQLQLEEVRGQLRYLDDQTAFATISVTVSERGVPAAASGNGGWGIADAWGAAARGFERVIGGAFVGIATAAPVLLALGLGFLGWRVLRRRREAGTARRATPQV